MSMKNWFLGAFVAVAVTGVALYVGNNVMNAFDGKDAPRAPAAAPASASAAAAQGCAASRFAVVSKSERVEAGRIVITAAVRNDNDKACGVQINLQVFDKAGQLRGVEQPWVAGVQNIPAGAQHSFDVILPAQLSKIGGEGSYSIDPMAAKAWEAR